MTDLDTRTALGFLTERRDFFHVTVTPGCNGWGYDVVLRIDGSYSTKEAAEAAAEGMKEWIEGITDIPKDRWHNWVRAEPESSTK